MGPYAYTDPGPGIPAGATAWTAEQAVTAGIFIAAAPSRFFIFKTPLETLAVAGAKGVWDAVLILLVIWPALLL